MDKAVLDKRPDRHETVFGADLLAFREIPRRIVYRHLKYRNMLPSDLSSHFRTEFKAFTGEIK